MSLNIKIEELLNMHLVITTITGEAHTKNRANKKKILKLFLNLLHIYLYSLNRFSLLVNFTLFLFAILMMILNVLLTPTTFWPPIAIYVQNKDETASSRCLSAGPPPLVTTASMVALDRLLCLVNKAKAFSNCIAFFLCNHYICMCNSSKFST